MKTFIISLTAFLLLAIAMPQLVHAQGCSVFTGQGGDMIPDKTCAPVKVKYQARFFSNYSPAVLTDMKIMVTWGDGTWDELVAQNTYDGSSYTYFIDVEHIYPKGGTSCRYNVVASPRVNGTLCTGTVDEKKVTVWDTDDENGGEIAIDPPVYFVCPGEEFSVTFQDVSTWNCTPPTETDNINWPARWTQFIYGTGTTAGTRISGIEVNGAEQTYPYSGNIKAHIDWQLGPDHTSYVVKVPATAQVGEVFEVTLRNWNACNPYDDPAVNGPPANAQDGDFAPVTSVAIIKIVDRPQGAITTLNKVDVPTDNFCPGEQIKFRGQQTNAGVTNVRYDWYIYNDAAGTELLEIKNNTKNWSRDAGFPTAGQKLIKLRIKNNDAANNCWGEITKIINVFAAPTVASSINGTTGNLQEFCWEGNNISVAFNFQLFSANNYKYQISLYQRNSTATTPDGAVLAEQDVAGGQTANAPYNLTITQPGIYKVRLTATDKITGCETIEESSVVVYDKPQPAFSIDPLCEGQVAYFTDASSLPSSVNGDAIALWEWDVNYDGSNFTADYTGETGVEHTYAAPGSYPVALRLTTTKGCTNMLVQNMVVKPVPQAVLDYDYTQPICPGEPVLFTNLSNNSATTFPAGVTYTLVINDGGVVSRYPMTAATLERTFANNGSAVKTYEVWLEARANDPNNCAINSDKRYLDVKPGAIAGFIAPGYDPLGKNCSPLDLALQVNQATIDIDADRYTWTVLRGTTELQNVVQLKGDADFGKLQYKATNNTNNSLTYIVQLVAEKANQCIVPAEERYRVNPVPTADFTVTQVSQSCEETILEVQVTNTSGISSYNWTIFPEPENISSVIYDDKFQIIYKRPTVTAPSYNVDISLVTQNFFECESPEVTKQHTIRAQELDEVKVVVISPENEGCGPLEIEFENQTVNPPAGTQYTVMMRRGSLPEQELIPESGSADSKFTYTFTEAGNYQIWLKATAPDGCVRYQTVPAQVVVYPDPSAAFTVDVTEGCAPLTVSLNKANVTGVRRTWTVTDLSNNQPVYGPAIFDPASTDDFSYIKLENDTDVNKQYRISLTTESAEGCTASASQDITVNPQPEATFDLVGGPNLCEPYTIQVNNTSSNPSGTTYTWEWGDGTTTNSTDASISKTYTNDTYTTTLNRTVKLTARTPSGCIIETSKQLAVAPRVKANFDADKLTGCAPLQVTFTNLSQGNSSASSGWYIKQPGANTFDAMGSTLSSYNFANTGSDPVVYEVRYVAANDAGCTDSFTRQITVNPEIQLQLAPNQTEGCSPNVVLFTLSNPNPQANMRYTWQWGDGSANEVYTTADPVTHSFENNGTSQRTYTVKVTAENTSTLCSITLSQEIKVFPQAVANVAPNVTSGCSPLQLSFQNNSQNATTHKWSIVRTDNGTEVYTSTSQLPAVQTLSNNTSAPLVYRVIYTASSAEGCSSAQQHDITVNPEIMAAFSMSTAQDCSPATITFTNDKVEQGVTYTWQWGDGSADVQTTTQSSLQHTFENASTSVPRQYTVRLSATNTATGCTSQTSQAVTVNPKVVANVVPTVTSGCAPLQVGFQNNSQNAASHYWEVKRRDNGEVVHIATTSIPDIDPLPNNTASPLIYDVYYTATSPQGCTEEQQHAITVNPGVAAAFTMDVNAAICGPTTVTFTNTNLQSGVTYTWQWGDGSTSEITTTEAQITHTFSNNLLDRSRFYEVTLTATNTAYGCSSVTRQTVQVYPAIEVAVSPDRTVICAPDQVNFSNRSQNAATHEWFYRLQGTADKLEVLNTAEVSYHFTNTTNAVQIYEVVYTGTSTTGCSATAVNTITVYPTLAPSFTVDTNRPVLPNAVVTITNTTPHAGAWTYTWDFGDGTSSTSVNPGSKTYQRYGTYTITLTISNGQCTETFTKEIRVDDIPPRVDFESVPISGCEPLLVQFQNTSEYADNATFEWDFGDGATSRAVNPSHSFYAERDPATGAAIVTEYTVTLTGRNYTGVSETVSRKTVTVYPNPVAGFSIRETVVQVPGDPVFVSNHSTGADSYWWDFGDGTTYEEENPIHYYQEPGIYSITLVATSAWGCSDTLTLNELVTAEAGGQVKIPNAFTPNTGGPNDGSIDVTGDNDVFFPVLEGGIKQYNMRIYNRWGELLFETTDRSVGWNGYYKGQLCKSDVYAFKIYVEFSDGKTLQQIGDVTLIR